MNALSLLTKTWVRHRLLFHWTIILAVLGFCAVDCYTMLGGLAHTVEWMKIFLCPCPFI